MKHISIRTCIGCGIKKDKIEFIRLVKNKQNTINIDETGKNEGRGTYICNNEECYYKAFKFKKLERAFKMKINEEIYERLKGKILDK